MSIVVPIVFFTLALVTIVYVLPAVSSPLYFDPSTIFCLPASIAKCGIPSNLPYVIHF